MAFAALEEALFVAGDWRELLGVYQRRLAASDISGGRAPKQRARVPLRLAQVQGERIHDEQAALASLREATLLIRRCDRRWRSCGSCSPSVETGTAAALALAQAEEKLPMRPSERAQLASETGALWLDVRGDAAKARACYERALEAEGSFAPVLAWDRERR